MSAIGYVQTTMDERERRHGNNVRGRERLPSTGFVAENASVVIHSGGARIVGALDVIRDDRDQPIRSPDWFTTAITPQGHSVSYALTNGRSAIPRRPLWTAETGSYQRDRLVKAVALGFLLPECGCIQDQLARRRLGIVTIRPSAIVAKELLDGRAPCVGECQCFAIEQAARRAIHEERERERAAEVRAQNPQAKTDDALKLLAESVTALMQDARPKGKRT